MIMDKTGLFSDSQAITATAASTNLIDLGSGAAASGTGVGKKGVGMGTDIPLVIAVTQAFATGTSLTISVETDDNAGFSSATTVWTSPAYTTAQLNAAFAGDRYLLPDRLPATVNERYVRLKYTVAGSDYTTGKITAGTTLARQTN